MFEPTYLSPNGIGVFWMIYKRISVALYFVNLVVARDLYVIYGIHSIPFEHQSDCRRLCQRHDIVEFKRAEHAALIAVSRTVNVGIGIVVRVHVHDYARNVAFYFIERLESAAAYVSAYRYVAITCIFQPRLFSIVYNAEFIAATRTV